MLLVMMVSFRNVAGEPAFVELSENIVGVPVSGAGRVHVTSPAVAFKEP
jgi:hypothetical protein